MPESTKGKLNPEMASIEIGVRHLRNVTFYPLSVAHQLKMTDILESVFKEMVKISSDNEESVALFVAKALEIIKENISIIVSMVTDEEPDSVLSDMTNSQLVKVIDYVYKTNFEGPVKNLLSLFQGEEDKSWKDLISKQLLQPSAKSISTDSKTSTEKVSGKGASPSVK